MTQFKLLLLCIFLLSYNESRSQNRVQSWEVEAGFGVQQKFRIDEPVKTAIIASQAKSITPIIKLSYDKTIKKHFASFLVQRNCVSENRHIVLGHLSQVHKTCILNFFIKRYHKSFFLSGYRGSKCQAIKKMFCVRCPILETCYDFYAITKVTAHKNHKWFTSIILVCWYG